MAKGDFDYKRAWTEICKPAFDVLPQNIRDLYELISYDFGDAQQDKNTDMPWPDPKEYGGITLRTMFDEIPSEWLSFAARVIYFYGHWASGGAVEDKTGAHWKFAHWADQTLARKLGLPEFRGRARDANGISYSVVEGFLRVHFNNHNSWTWEELGVATQTMYEKALGVLSVQSRCAEKFYQEKLKELKALKGWDGEFKMLTPFLDIDNFKEKGEDEYAIISALGDSGLLLHDIAKVNAKPHPYVIGTSHLTHCESGILSDSSIRHMEKYHGVHCAHPGGCHVKYEDHTSDKVAFLRIKDDDSDSENVNLTDEQKAALSSQLMKDACEKYKIDGFAFVRD